MRRRRTATLFASLLAGASLGCPVQGLARGPQISVAAGPLGEALASLSRQTGISIGIEGRLPPISTRPVEGIMSAETALRRMLKGSGLAAIRVGPASYRLVASKNAEPARVAAPIVVQPQDIVVTANKRNEALLDIPFSVAVVPFPDGALMSGLTGTAGVAARIDGLALTNIGPGHNRQFIRGVADSPFNGPSQSTVSLQIDDVRATYNAPDPDLHLVDVERVEVLKGPQGPLYGTGALGGVYHIVTRKPDLQRVSAFAAANGALVSDGDYGFGGQAMLNIPLVGERIGVRVVGYANREPGWIDTPTGKDRNYMKMSGGRAALRVVPAEGWALDIAGAVQWRHVDDSQYVFLRHSRFRDTMIAEPQDNDFRMASATLRGALGGVEIVAAAGLVGHEVKNRLDASASAAALGASSPALVDEEHKYRVMDSELRLSGGHERSLQWLAGLSYLNADNRQGNELSAAGQTASQPLLSWRQQVSEWALFGDVSLPLLPRVRVTAGGRLFHWSIENETGIDLSASSSSRHKTGVTPSLAVQWKPDSRTMMFIRYASAFRPGGLSPAGGANSAYDSDELANFELGLRLAGFRGLSLAATLYHTRWLHIQSDSLLGNGLVSTRNAGNGQVDGVDASVSWQPGGWSVEAGAQLQQARLTKAFSGTVVDDTRLPVVPDFASRLTLSHRLSLDGWQGDVRLAARYSGSARLSLDTGLDRRMGDYATVDLSISLGKGPWSLAANLTNLLDSRADSFAFGNPFSIRTVQQFTPLRPRMLGIVVSLH